MLWNMKKGIESESNDLHWLFLQRIYNDAHDMIHCDVTLYTVKQRSSKYYELKLFMLLLILLKAFLYLAFSYCVDVYKRLFIR